MKRPSILVLGAGLVGSEIACCLSELANVTVVDRNSKALVALRTRRKDSLHQICADFFDTEYMRKLAASHDVVVGAIEPSIAYTVLTQVAEAGTPIVDISFYEESPLSLNLVAERCGIPIVVDCGVAPGLSNMLLGREMTRMRVDTFVCQCGGLPAEPKAPWYYKAPFAPRSVIDLYTRKAVIVSNGKRVELDPLESPAKVRLSEYPELGMLMGITSDGLRTLLDTTDVANMIDQSLRYPAHMRLVQDFIKSGFLSEDPVSVKNCDGRFVDVVPRVFTERILADAWRLEDDEDEFTVFVAKMEGIVQGRRVFVTYNALERRDPVTGATSMSRMTGYPCAAVALMLARKEITRHGVIAPETIGGDEQQMQFVLDFMAAKGVSLSRSETVETIK
ncbi:MAG: saccharopine dehydrogenase C-terminal domain-containing protein [Candidatus Spechtbacterales bacterium]